MEVAARGWEQLAEELEHRLTRNTGRQQDIPAGPGSHHREAHPSAPSEQGEKNRSGRQNRSPDHQKCT
jgi:hypothetical protein